MVISRKNPPPEISSAYKAHFHSMKVRKEPPMPLSPEEIAAIKECDYVGDLDWLGEGRAGR